VSEADNLRFWCTRQIVKLRYFCSVLASNKSNTKQETSCSLGIPSEVVGGCRSCRYDAALKIAMCDAVFQCIEALTKRDSPSAWRSFQSEIEAQLALLHKQEQESDLRSDQTAMRECISSINIKAFVAISEGQCANHALDSLVASAARCASHDTVKLQVEFLKDLHHLARIVCDDNHRRV